MTTKIPDSMLETPGGGGGGSSGNVDGGTPTTNYGATTAVDGGSP